MIDPTIGESDDFDFNQNSYLEHYALNQNISAKENKTILNKNDVVFFDKKENIMPYSNKKSECRNLIKFSFDIPKMCRKNNEEILKNEKSDFSMKENKKGFVFNLPAKKKDCLNNFNFSKLNIQSSNFFESTAHKNANPIEYDTDINKPPQNFFLNESTRCLNTIEKNTHFFKELDFNLKKKEKRKFPNFNLNEKSKELTEKKNKNVFSEIKQEKNFDLAARDSCSKPERKKFEFTLSKITNKQKMEGKQYEMQKAFNLQNLECLLEKISENEETIRYSEDEQNYKPILEDDYGLVGFGSNKNHFNSKLNFSKNDSDVNMETSNIQDKNTTSAMVLDNENIKTSMTNEDLENEINNLNIVFDTLETKLVEKKSRIFFFKSKKLIFIEIFSLANSFR
jgi:hypothetical protein